MLNALLKICHQPFAQLAERFWPGGLTLIVEAKSLPPEVTAGGDTVGIRMPDHPLALALLQRFGGAIATTSANKSDEPPAIFSRGSPIRTWRTSQHYP